MGRCGRRGRRRRRRRARERGFARFGALWRGGRG
uniref:Uncharacterized protein n=1 Tax=Arundo donax TaxID=35708 RepID=A0A0A9HU20_ARUDO